MSKPLPVPARINLRGLCCSVALCVLGATSLFLTGCGASSQTGPPRPPPPGSYAGATFSGKALAGTQPIVGATVQLYAAGTTGNGSASTSLLASAITTDATGAFTVPSGYECPSSGAQLFVTVTGGKVAAAADNSAILLTTVLGACNQLAASSQVVINEATTTATVWSLSQFLTGSGNLGASSTNAQGLADAVATAANLVNLTTGTSPGASFPANGTSPASKIDSIANLLNTCTAAATAAPCTQLFSATTPSGGTTPANTFAAALYLARNPGMNTASLYTQSIASNVFSPGLSKAPSDWTLFINYTGGGMNAPGPLGIDASGNVWVASYFSVASKFSPTGDPAFPQGVTAGGIAHSYGLAIDAANDVWITNEDTASSVNGGLGSVTVLNSDGQTISGTSGYSAGGFNYPVAIAVDTNSTAWVVDNGNAHLTVLSTTTGQPISGTKGYPPAAVSDPLAFPAAIALDAGHNAWVGNENADYITRVSSDGTQFSNVPCCNGAAALAVDQGGNVWVANYLGNSVSEVSNSGTVIYNGYTGGGLSHPQGVAIDGAGNVWVSNVGGPSITELAGASSSSPGHVLSPASGFAPDAGLSKAFAIAIDASGNLWVTNFGNNSLTEFIGLAAPVKTPLLGPPQSP